MCVGPGSGQGQPPRMCYRLRDVLKSSYRAVPVTPDLGTGLLALKSLGEPFRPFGQPFERLDESGVNG